MRKTNKRQNVTASVAVKAIRTASKKKKAVKHRAPKMIEHECTISGAWEDGKSIIETLGEEMRAWADNMEEKFGTTQKYETVSTTAETLEGIDVTIPEEFEGEENKKFIFKYSTVALSPSKMRHRSRANQCSDAVEIWNNLVTYLDQISEDEKEYTKEERDAAENMSSEVQNAIDEVEGCEFPSSFG